MLYDAKTPEAYFAQLDDDWRREKLLELRDLIKTAAPSLEETIHYKMLGYGMGGSYLFHLNAQRGYVSLYAGNLEKVDPNGELVVGLNVGKGCVRFTKTKSVADSRIDEFIARAFQLWAAGQDIGC